MPGNAEQIEQGALAIRERRTNFFDRGTKWWWEPGRNAHESRPSGRAYAAAPVPGFADA